MKDITTYINEGKSTPIQMTVREFFYYYTGGLDEDSFDSADLGYDLFGEDGTAKDVVKYLNKYKNTKVSVAYQHVSGADGGYDEIIVTGLPENAGNRFDTVAGSDSEFKQAAKEAIKELKKGGA